MMLQGIEPSTLTVTLSRCCLITALPSSPSSVTSHLSSGVCFFPRRQIELPGGPAHTGLVWLHQLLLQTNLHLGSRECSAKITALMFYSCPTDQRDTKTPSRFILQSDAQAEQEVIDLQGSLSNTQRVTRAHWQLGLFLTRQLSLISAAQDFTVLFKYPHRFPTQPYCSSLL